LTRHAVSVTGLVAPDDLGYTLPHEHLFATTAYAFPPQGEEALLPITIERLGAIRADLMTSLENITLDETCDQAAEVAKRGTPASGRSWSSLRRASGATPSGWPRSRAQPA
jgi:predicted metal-dependent phosphotriesterase family hydrolase